ncbi:hypothetical protein NEOLEDRAFT_1164870 [Neolentinus lepideus HHB14362 ss-1]|uniref:Uncharacterized protein n=1 Tax=Neolentinus lepideus HHB14362 ss-1 TaxID=1314782 RepID=A0A165PBF8_9AGAM|nr:hypothetical protein NEOLEDRAFT_1164870 [Neolentinus lepideus HHB14362 ss-1]
MTRLLPRLSESLRRAKARLPRRSPASPRRCRKNTVPKPILPPLAAVRAPGRSQSILVDELNPIVNAKAFVRHKSPPPRIQRNNSRDGRGEMSDQEKDWWSSPYLRMLSTPIRVCLSTGRHFPSDFLVRVGVMEQPGTHILRSKHYLLPDGIEHPKFKKRRAAISAYVVCWKTAMEQLIHTGSYKRLSGQPIAHPRLTEQIGHLLRLRVVQELELLLRRLRTRPQHSHDAPLIRRLTRTEWKALKETGTIPQENAVAVIVCPPVNRDPKTKARPEPKMTASPEADTPGNPPFRPKREPPPLSRLYPTTSYSLDDPPGLLPQARVPLYNSAVLFPEPSHRSAFHARLMCLLSIERRARFKEAIKVKISDARAGSPDDSQKDRDQKASHAFLLYSGWTSLERADAVSLAIALWRVRMWEGDTCANSKEWHAGGWEDPSLRL